MADLTAVTLDGLSVTYRSPGRDVAALLRATLRDVGMAGSVRGGR